MEKMKKNKNKKFLGIQKSRMSGPFSQEGDVKAVESIPSATFQEIFNDPSKPDKSSPKVPKKVIRKEEISKPFLFRHLQHVGLDGNDAELNDEWLQYLTLLGISKEIFSFEPSKAQQICDDVAVKGGISKALKELKDDQTDGNSRKTPPNGTTESEHSENLPTQNVSGDEDSDISFVPTHYSLPVPARNEEKDSISPLNFVQKHFSTYDEESESFPTLQHSATFGKYTHDEADIQEKTNSKRSRSVPVKRLPGINSDETQYRPKYKTSVFGSGNVVVGDNNTINIRSPKTPPGHKKGSLKVKNPTRSRSSPVQPDQGASKFHTTVLNSGNVVVGDNTIISITKPAEDTRKKGKLVTQEQNRNSKYNLFPSAFDHSFDYPEQLKLGKSFHSAPASFDEESTNEVSSFLPPHSSAPERSYNGNSTVEDPTENNMSTEGKISVENPWPLKPSEPNQRTVEDSKDTNDPLWGELQGGEKPPAESQLLSQIQAKIHQMEEGKSVAYKSKFLISMMQCDSRGQQLLDYLGVTPEKLQDKQTAENVYTFIKDNGGLEKTLAKIAISDQEEKVPEEIKLRGPTAFKAYQHALKFGSTLDTRVRIMFIGQEGAGKTSLKKSLLRQAFDPHEETTEGISCDGQVTVESCQSWEPGKKLEFADHAAKCVLESMKDGSFEDSQEGQTEDEEMAEQKAVIAAPNDTDGNKTSEHTQTKNTSKESSASEEHLASGGTVQEAPSNLKEESKNEEKSLPDEIVSKMLNLTLQGNEVSNEETESLCPDLWDFAGQTLFYATHAVFMSRQGIYILAHDSTKDLYSKAEPRKIPGSDATDIHSSESNLDFINFWLSSVHMFNKRSTKVSETNPPNSESSITVPPVILVFTKADVILQQGEDKEKRKIELLSEIIKSIDECSFKSHLLLRCENVFFVDNSKSGVDTEDEDVQNLRNFILELAKRLPHTREVIPLRWLNAEKFATDLPKKDKVFYIETEKLKQLWKTRCQIEDNVENESRTLLNFLHDRGVILHFEETEALDKLVILHPQWLIDLFKKIITMPMFHEQQNEPLQINKYRKKLEKDGILSDELVDYVCKQSCGENQNITKEAIISLMEMFGLTCKWINNNGSQFYIVPCMLRSVPDQLLVNSDDPSELHPIFICFRDGYVPIGLFPRLVASAIRWSIMRWSNDPPILRKNLVQIHVGENNSYATVLSCSMYHIKVKLISDKDEEEEESYDDLADLCSTVIEFLKRCMSHMGKEFHWLDNMGYHFAIKCNKCFGERELDGSCLQHRSKDCMSDDCAHFLPVELPDNSKTLRCRNIIGGKSTIRIDKRWCHVKKKQEDITSAKVPQVKVSEAICRDISGHISAQIWKELLSKLGLGSTKITHIDNDYDLTREKVYQGLIVWYDQGTATMSELTNALEDLDSAVVDKLKDGSAYYSPPIQEMSSGHVVTETFCRAVSVEVADQWKWLLRYLSVPERIIRNTERNASPYTVQEQCFQGLLTWIRAEGSDAQHSDLVEALKAIGRARIVL